MFWHSCSAREELHENTNMIRKSAPAGVCFVAALHWVEVGAGFVLFLPLHSFLTFEIQEFPPVSDWGTFLNNTSSGVQCGAPEHRSLEQFCIPLSTSASNTVKSWL